MLKKLIIVCIVCLLGVSLNAVEEEVSDFEYLKIKIDVLTAHLDTGPILLNTVKLRDVLIKEMRKVVDELWVLKYSETQEQTQTRLTGAMTRLKKILELKVVVQLFEKEYIVGLSKLLVCENLEELEFEALEFAEYNLNSMDQDTAVMISKMTRLMKEARRELDKANEALSAG